MFGAKLCELGVMPTAIALSFARLFPLAQGQALSAPFTHDRTGVALSLLVAIATAFAFLELGERAQARPGFEGRVWNAAAGAMFGFCMWAPHFIGLLALRSPLVHGLSTDPTLVSAGVSVLFCGVVFFAAGRQPGVVRTAVAGLCLGLCGVVMHYIGMTGLEVEADLSYRLGPALTTATGAALASAVALWASHRLEAPWLRIAAAFPSGATAAGLHYVDVASTVMTPRPDFGASVATSNVVLVIAATALSLLLAAAVAALAAMDRARGFSAGGSKRARGEAAVVEIPGGTGDDVVVVPQSRRSSGER